MATISSAVDAARSVTEWLGPELAILTEEAWQTPNACGIWSVADVAAHLLWVTDLYGDSIRRALADDVGPPSGQTAPANRVAPDAPRAWQQIWAGWPGSRGAIPATYRQDLGDRLADAFRGWSAALVALFESLAPTDWDRPAFLMLGVRPIRRLLCFYVLEVGVHGWDILHRIGRDADLPTASFLPVIEALPTHLQGRFAPRERLAEPERYRFELGPAVPGNVCLTVQGDTFELAPAPADTAADVVLTMDPQTFVLCFMGRLGWVQAMQADGVTLTGRQERAARIPAWFGLS